MIGRHAIRAALADRAVDRVVAIARAGAGFTHDKLTEHLGPDLERLVERPEVVADLTGVAGCLLCLGISSVRKSEADYRRITVDLTLTLARAVERDSPGAVLVYVSGRGTDRTGTSRLMWARVKGETENALLAMNLRGCMFRPGLIVPDSSSPSRTGWYNTLFRVVAPLIPVIRALAPRLLITADQMSAAMIGTVLSGPTQEICENPDIQELARRGRGK